MAYPTNYAGWVTLLKDFLDVDDFSDGQLGVFLSLAQTRLNRELNSQYMEGWGILICNSDSGYMDLTSPADFLGQNYNRVRLVAPISDSMPLTALAINELYTMIGEANGQGAGKPKYYAIEAFTLLTYPFMLNGDAAELYYYILVDEISPTKDDNVFTTYHPDMLLYAACLEGSRFIVEDERIPTWNDAYNQGLIAANNVAKNSKMGSTPLKRLITMYKTG